MVLRVFQECVDCCAELVEVLLVAAYCAAPEGWDFGAVLED